MTKYLSTSNTKHWLVKIKLLFAIIFMVAFSVSCDTEDDINSIFVGNTWYVNGFTINGKSAGGDEIKTLYADANAFSIYFSSSNSFNGMLSTGCTISGNWVANGKNQTIAFSFKNPHWQYGIQYIEKCQQVLRRRQHHRNQNRQQKLNKANT